MRSTSNIPATGADRQSPCVDSRSGCVLSLLLPSAAAEFHPPLKTADGFAVPQPGRRFEFPRDHGSHPDFKIEWWYVTGHLFGESDRRFGFQATFFRRAGPPPTNGSAVAGHFSTVWQRRVASRAHGAAGCARRAVHPRGTVEPAGLGCRVEHQHAGGAQRQLVLASGHRTRAALCRCKVPFAVKPPFRSNSPRPSRSCVFGENGVSRKGASPTASSHYLTFSRLEVAGERDAGWPEASRPRAGVDGPRDQQQPTG